jgi:cytochrome c-type biogenesis protein CcmH/NrfG
VRAAILIPVLTALAFAGDTTERARELYRKTDYADAIASLKQGGLKQGESDAQSLELLGQCYYQLGDFKKATDALEKATTFAPADSMIQDWLGRAWGERAETSFAFAAAAHARKAREAFEKAVRLDPANAMAMNDLFDYYIQAPGFLGGGIEKARELIPSLAKLDPLGAHLAQAKLDEEKKQFAAAETELRAAIGMGPEKVYPVLELAQFLARRNRHEESDQAFQQAASVAPDSPRILFARAESLIKGKRNVAEARDLLKQYLAAQGLTPDDPPRWEALRLMKKAPEGQ